MPWKGREDRGWGGSQSRADREESQAGWEAGGRRDGGAWGPVRRGGEAGCERASTRVHPWVWFKRTHPTLTRGKVFL